MSADTRKGGKPSDELLRGFRATVHGVIMWRRRLYASDRHTVHKYSALCHIGWCLVLLFLAPDLFDRQPSLAPLALLAPEWFWAGWSAAIGLVQVGGLGGYGLRWRAERACEFIGAYVSAMWWGWILFIVARDGGISTAEPTYMVFFVFSLWAIRHVPHPCDWRRR